MRYQVPHTLNQTIQILQGLQSINSMPLYEQSTVSHVPSNKQKWWRFFLNSYLLCPILEETELRRKNGRHKKEQTPKTHTPAYKPLLSMYILAYGRGK